MNRHRQGNIRSQRVARSARAAVVTAALFAIGATALLAAGATALPASASAAKKAAKKKPATATTPAVFCSATVVDNYRAPLEKLQPIPALPEGGVLRFAPAGMTLAPTGPSGLLVGASTVGFHLTNSAPAGSAAPRLNWTVLERLTRLTQNGQRPHPAGLKRINLGQLPPGVHRGLSFPLAPTPAVYSLEVTIQNHRGRLLGRYGEYIRVVNRAVNAGLTLVAYDNVSPGASLEACFENHGTASVAPAAANLERLVNSTWRPVVAEPRYLLAGPSTSRLLGPGEAERITTPLPTNALPGLYKLTIPGVTEIGEPLAVSAEFGVL